MIAIEATGAPEEAAAMAVPVFADREWGPGADSVLDRLGEWVIQFLDAEDFSGKAGEIADVAAGGGAPWSTVFFVGLGEGFDAEELRKAAGTLGRRAAHLESLATTLHQVGEGAGAGPSAEGFILGQYRFDKYRSEPKPAKTDRLLLVDANERALEAARRGAIVASAATLARDLTNEPPVTKTPAMLADRALQIGRDHGMRVKVYDEAQIAAEGFGGVAAVAAGSHNPARVVEMWHEPQEARAFLALVGKGVVFDSGGLSIKPAKAMEEMKTDMAGGAAVLGAMQAIAELDLPVKVLAVVPFTENMPGGGAQRPGDVLTARNGKTIEVLDTDAEGRLVLADALALAAEAGPDLIVDLATLTGACKVALGEGFAGLFGNDEASSDRVQAAAARSGERVWPMPLPKDYRSKIDSDVADMKNTGPRWGGAINAALLLQEFVDDRPWVHLDIAGPARADGDEGYLLKGGTGFGVRLLVALAEEMSA